MIYLIPKTLKCPLASQTGRKAFLVMNSAFAGSSVLPVGSRNWGKENSWAVILLQSEIFSKRDSLA